MATQLHKSLPPEAPGPFTPPSERNLWTILFQHKLLVLFGALLGVGLAALYYVYCPPAFQSTAQVLVGKKGVDQTAGPEPRQGPVEEFAATKSTVMKSYVIVSRALRKLPPDTLSLSEKEKADPVEAVRKRLTITQSKDITGAANSIVTLAYRGRGAEECNAVLKAVIDSYQEFLDEEYEKVSAETVKNLTQNTAKLKEQLEKKRTAYIEFRKHAPIVGKPGEAGTMRQERLNKIEEKRTTLLVRQAEVEGQLSTLQQAIKEGRSRDSLLAMVDGMVIKLEGDAARAGQSAALREHLLQLLLQEQKALEKFGDAHPEVAGLRKRIETTRANIIRQVPWAGLVSGAGQDGKPLDPVDGWLAYLKQEEETVRSSERLLAGLVKVENDEEKQLQPFELQDRNFYTDIKADELLLASNMKRLNELSLSRDAGGYGARVISPPGSGGTKQVEPNLLIVAAAGAILALLLGVLLPLLADSLDRGFRTPEEVSRRLGVAVVGHIPYLRGRRAPRPRKGQPPVPPILAACNTPATAEAYRSLQTVLSTVVRDRGPRVIQITSSVTGEGTTRVAANLAIAMAQSGKSVVLVDANFHRPRVHILFGLHGEAGLSSVLEGNASPEEVIQSSAVEGLYILPCGALTRHPFELLNSAQFKELIRVLRQHYDLVVLDTPALLAVTDPCAVAPHADGVILTLGVPRTTRPQAERARELLRAVATPLLGVVVNQVGRSGSYRGHRFDPYVGGVAWAPKPSLNGIEHAPEVNGAVRAGLGEPARPL
jgi:capsular exopolysaccharide synthesis family protein